MASQTLDPVATTPISACLLTPRKGQMRTIPLDSEANTRGTFKSQHDTAKSGTLLENPPDESLTKFSTYIN